MSETGADGCGDGLFGPGLNTICRGGFDFTLLFEDSILNLLPAACFLLLGPLRILQVARKRDQIRRSPVYLWKLVAASVFIVIQTVALAFAAADHNRLSQVALPAAVLDLVASVVLVALVHFEHFKSIRPSLLACVFLSVTALLDIARLRSAWMQLSSTGWTASLTASLVAKFILLALESVEKRSLSLNPEKTWAKESTSSPFNRALFIWLNRLLKTGWQATLVPDSLPAVDESLDVDVVFNKLDESWRSVDRKKKYSLLLALFKAFKLEMLAIVIPRLCVVGLSIAQPFMIGQTVTFLQGADKSNNTGYGLLGAFILVFTLTAVARALYQHLGYRVMTMLRGGLIATLYNHMMNLPAESVSESGALSLMGSDAEAFAEFFHATITDSWADIVQLAVAIYLLARMIGAIVIAPVIIAVLFTFLSFKVGDMMSGRQRAWMEATQRRVNFTTEILSRIRDAKILGLAEYLSTAITGLRDDELAKSKAFRRVSSFKVCLVNSPMLLGQFAVFAAYGIAAKIQGTGQLSVAETVTTLSLVDLLLVPLRSLIYAIPQTFSAVSCLRRIQEFLAQDPQQERRVLGSSPATTSLEAQDNRRWQRPKQSSGIELAPMDISTTNRKSNTTSKDAMPSISLRDATFGWDSPSDTETQLSTKDAGLSFESPSQGSLTVITGPVGCGKSTLLKAILGETAFLRGRVILSTAEVAYCSQDPWIINGSIRENVISGASDEYVDNQWYSTVLTACALDVDLAGMPSGENTIVGSKGIKLSGGQKQRIALARAIYSKKRIVLLDDVFSGLDNATRSTVFHRVCGPDGLLRQTGCTVVITAPLTAGQYFSMADYIIVLGPAGKVAEQGTFDTLKEAGSSVAMLDSTHHGRVADDDTMDKGPEERDSNKASGDEVEAAGDLLHTPDFTIWKFWLSAMGWSNIVLLALFLTIESGFGAVPYVWLTKWSESTDAATSSNLGYWMGVYAVWGFLSTTGLALAVYWVWVVIVPTASRKLHSAILSATMGATVSFLSSTETGLLINRFSQDMRLVDFVLPIGFIETAFGLWGNVAQTAVAIAALPYLAAVIPFAIGILVLIQRFYLRTSRQLRLLDIEMKAPVFSHFIESLHGLVTIRAFGWKAQYLSKSLTLLDAAQRPYYLLLAVQRWLSLVLNLVVAGIAILLVGISIALRDRVQPGLLGVALVLMTNLGEQITRLITSWTTLETSLGAISRVKSFAETTPQEEPPSSFASQPTTLPQSWPNSGAITISSLTASHSPPTTSPTSAADPVLKSITLSIPPGSKIGIVGRTGSGKSSLLQTLLGITHIHSGRVTIDGQDISLLPPSLLRSRLNCLTQEPFLWGGGSVRDNADPLGERGDGDVVEALRVVGVWGVLLAKGMASGGGEAGDEAEVRQVLEMKMDENTLSHGQRQLFAVARALLRRGRKVLLLDEPTSRLDAASHDLVQEAIRSHFEGCTVVMVAHRLDSLMDFDQVVVLDAGRVVEFDNPRTLLSDEGSAFARLYYGAGRRV